MKGEIIRVNIQAWQDRENVVKALAHAGYKVWVEEKKDGQMYGRTKMMVCFERTQIKTGED